MIVTIIAGLAVLLLGRQLFWLFVGVAGFAAGFELATNFLGSQSDGMILLVAVLVGVIGALVAVFFRYIAVAVAGFASGAYLGTLLLPVLQTDSAWIFWIFFITGGVIGAALLVLLFDWALIGLSAVTGASMLVPLTDWSPTLKILLFIVLVVVGIVVQVYFFTGEEDNKKIEQRKVSQSTET
jgi:hypothetical protein